jgi:hypothetical protein
MGMSYEQLIKLAEQFKENVWYFIACHDINILEVQKLKDQVNEVLDTIDELPFEN